MLLDIRYGLRQLRRNKVLGVVVVLLLGIGIGASTVIFGLVNSLILRSLPVKHPNNLFLIEKNRKQQVRPDTDFYYTVYENLQARKQLLPSIIAEQLWDDNSFFPLENAGSFRMISTEIVSPNYFTSLGVRPFLGRLLEPADPNVTSGVPAVISYQFWRTEFNGDKHVIGHILRLKKFPFRIVGVVPREFHSIDIERAPDVRLPLSAAPILYGQTVYATHPSRPLLFELLARLAPGITPATAGAAVTEVTRTGDESVLRSFPVPDPKMRALQDSYIRSFCNYRVAFESVAHGVSRLRTQFSTALYVLLGAVGLLLLAVTANISGLLLARAEQRSTEVAIRASIGASRVQVMRQFLVEHLLLVLPVTALAIAFSAAVAPILLEQLPRARALVSSYTTPQIFDTEATRWTVLFAIAISLTTLTVTALISTWRILRKQVSEGLKNYAQGGRRSLTGTVLVTMQISLGVVLIAGAVLMMKTFWNLEHLNPGFDRAGVAEVIVGPQSAGYSDAQAQVFLAELQRQMATLPGIRSVASAWSDVMRGVGMKTTMAPEGVALPADTYLNTNANIVSVDYFATLGIPFLAGRNLESGDDAKKPQPIVVNTAFARHFFPHQNPIGKLMVFGTGDGRSAPNGVIVGLVGTAKYRSLREMNPPIAYSLEKPGGGPVFYVRTYGDPAAAIGLIRGLLRQMDPRVPIAEAMTVEQKVASTLWEEKLVTILASFFGVIAVVLAAAGIYGALDYSVAARKREIGIRIAVGAVARDIVTALSRRMMAAVAIGVVLGIIVARLALIAARQLLFGVALLDPLMLTITIGTILGCALLAAMRPIIRAIKTDPLSALRME